MTDVRPDTMWTGTPLRIRPSQDSLTQATCAKLGKGAAGCDTGGKRLSQEAAPQAARPRFGSDAASYDTGSKNIDKLETTSGSAIERNSTMHGNRTASWLIAFCCTWSMIDMAMAQPTFPPEFYDPPPKGPVGETGRSLDESMSRWLTARVDRIHGKFLADLASKEAWESRRERYRREYFHMLGLWPFPEKTPLHATVTGELEGDGFRVEKLHFQSRPRLYVTANLYRPAKVDPNRRLPAVLYVCGHSGRGRNGNKTAFQSHGMWFARHGYICLVVDTLQLGEIAATHHGTYREQRWWWHSRGYTPAGVECWNAIRAVDYLVSRSDVDPARIGVTGISGGGAASFWAAAADERIAIAAPVSGMADLPSYVTRRVINGHCDCMFLYNTFEWPWTRIAALICPRPLLFVNSDHDRIFPMDANERIINRLELLYSRYGRSDRVEAVVSVGGHAYRKDIRQAVYRFFNTWFKNDARQVTDSEVDLVTRDERGRWHHPIPPEQLRVFPTDDDLPADQLNTTIDRHFVPQAHVKPPGQGEFAAWRARLLAELRRVTFHSIAQQVDPPKPPHAIEAGAYWTRGPEPVRTKPAAGFAAPDKPKRIVVVVRYGTATEPASSEWLRRLVQPDDLVIDLWPRGTGKRCWTEKNPPNYVRRSHALLGTTVDVERVGDVLSVARQLGHRYRAPVVVAGSSTAGLTAACAAALDQRIAGAWLHQIPASFMDPAAPPMLNILRVCDVPQILGMIGSRPLVLQGVAPEVRRQVEAIRHAAP